MRARINLIILNKHKSKSLWEQWLPFIMAPFGKKSGQLISQLMAGSLQLIADKLVEVFGKISGSTS